MSTFMCVDIGLLWWQKQVMSIHKMHCPSLEKSSQWKSRKKPSRYALPQSWKTITKKNKNSRYIYALTIDTQKAFKMSSLISFGCSILSVMNSLQGELVIQQPSFKHATFASARQRVSKKRILKTALSTFTPKIDMGPKIYAKVAFLDSSWNLICIAPYKFNFIPV